MSDRYFVDEPISPGRVVLAGPEAHHLIHVMRAAPGMQIVLFDGSGAEFPAIVQQVGRNEVELSVTLAGGNQSGTAGRGDARRRAAEGRSAEMAGRESGRVGRDADRAAADPAGSGAAGRASACAAAAGGRRGLETMRPQSPVADRRAPGLARFRGQRGRRAVPALGPAARLSPQVHICPFRRNWPMPVVLAVGPEGGFTGEEVALAVRRLAHHRPRPAHPSRGDGRPVAGGPGRRALDAMSECPTIASAPQISRRAPLKSQ